MVAEIFSTSCYNTNRDPPRKEVITMPTQIAATPVIKGEEAKKIYREANRKPSSKAEIGAKKLADMFEKMMG